MSEIPDPDHVSSLIAVAMEPRWHGTAVTRSGLHLQIRPAVPEDMDRLRHFFGQVAGDDIRHRFLSPMREVSDDAVWQMVRNDNPRQVDFLAIEPDTGDVLANAMLAAEPSLDRAEFAICTRADHKDEGISWTIMHHLVDFARAVGVKRLQSIQTADDELALRMDREMGFSVTRCPDDATLMIAERKF